MITVTIPAQQPDMNKYSDRDNCYLVEALSKLGYNAIVKGFGYTYIDGVTYVPTTPFNYLILARSFNKGEDITLTLVKTSLTNISHSINCIKEPYENDTEGDNTTP